MRGWEAGTLNIKWLIGAVTVDPSGARLPDVLVHWCQQQDLSLGFARGLSGRTGGVEEVAEQSAVPSLGPATHAVFFSIHHCQWTAEAGV